MKNFTNLKENKKGGIDAVYNGNPYTLTAKEVATVDMSKVTMLDESVKIEHAAKKAKRNNLVQLEESITQRHLIDAILGDQSAIAHIQNVTDQIDALG